MTIRISAETPWYDLFSRGARDWLRHNEKVREAVKDTLPDLLAGADLMTRPNRLALLISLNNPKEGTRRAWLNPAWRKNAARNSVVNPTRLVRSGVL